MAQRLQQQTDPSRFQACTGCRTAPMCEREDCRWGLLDIDEGPSDPHAAPARTLEARRGQQQAGGF